MGVVESLVVAAISAVVAIDQGKKAREAQKEQYDLQVEQQEQVEAQNAAEQARARRDNVRKARMAQAQIEAEQEATNTGGSSAGIAVGQTLSNQAATASSGGFAQQKAIGNQSILNSSMAAAQQREQTFAAISGFATNIGSSVLSSGVSQMGEV